MNVLHYLAAWLSRWIDDVASSALSIGSALRRRKKFLVVEQADETFEFQTARGLSAGKSFGKPLRFVDGRFTDGVGAPAGSSLAGGDVEIVLAARRFMFRTLELPSQAASFLDAIVRAQIDRLTPWSAALAAFGCGAPTQISEGRVGVTVAATARSQVMPLVNALERMGSDSVVVSAAPDAAIDARIAVFSVQASRQRRMRRMRRILVAVPSLIGLAAVGALSASVFVGAERDSAQLEVSRRLAERRAALTSGPSGVVAQAAAMLAQRKRETAPSVLILESLSRALPDDTYLGELQVEEGKLRISGVTREASSLIKIIEQTDRFRSATFFAPTIRAPDGTGEQFHIEAQIAAPFPAIQ